MIRYNVAAKAIWQAHSMPGCVVSVHSPQMRPSRLSSRPPHWGSALAASVLGHVVAIGLMLVWLPERPLPPPDEPSGVQMVFETPSESPLPKTEPIAVETPPSPAPVAEPPPVLEAPAVPPLPEPPPVAVPSPEFPPTEPPPMEPPPTGPSSEPAVPALPEPPPAAPAPPLPRSPSVERPKHPLRAQPRPHSVVRSPSTEHTPAPRAGTAAPAPAQTPTPPAEAPAAPISSTWQTALAAWFASHKTYPEAARRSGAEGTAVLRFTVARSGRVLDVAVARGTGSAILDAAAEALVHGATLPPFPAGMSQGSVTVTVQIHYSLTN